MRIFYFTLFHSTILTSLLLGGGLKIFADPRAWIANAFGLLWAFVEVSLRSNQFAMRWMDRLWVAAGLAGMISGFTSAIYQYANFRHLVWLDNWVIVAGLAIGFAGLMIRYSAIRTLGNYFSHEIKIITNHRIVQTGLYRYLRHPSYTGLALVCLGPVLFFGSVFVAIGMFFAMLVAFSLRIFVEERVLLDHFGDEYRAYQQRTKRLIPFVW